MAINFLQHLFQTKIECSAVSSDGYSPQNLISSSWREKNMGFLASHFIKPPVYLLFQLPFPINMQSLLIKPKVGSQISSGIDVFVAGIKHDCLTGVPGNQGKNPPNTSVSRLKAKRRRIELDPHNKSDNFDNIFHRYTASITTSSFKTEHRHLFTLVSRINDSSGKTFKIINKRHGGKVNPDFDASDEDNIYEFFQSHTLTYVTHVVICISRIHGSSVPALGRVEIWGQVSSSCGNSIMNYIADVQKKIIQQENELNPSKVSKNQNKDSSDKDSTERITKKEEGIEDNDIPSEFIDPITYSLMTIPMLLPSGLNIDFSTLEKHAEAERSWGRLPSDPFTGVLFTDDVKPLPNAALKARIDKFILASGVDVRNCGRTVGRPHDNLSSRSHLQRTSLNDKLVNPSMNEKLHVNRSLGGNGSKEDCMVKDRCKTEHGQSVINENKEACEKKLACCHDGEQVVHVQSHEEQVSQSLDSALMKTLQGSSFTRREQGFEKTTARNKPPMLCASSLVENHGEQTKFDTLSNKTLTENIHPEQASCFINTGCIGCKSPLNTLIVFELPCKHLVCRKCLTDQSSVYKMMKCSLCGGVFGRTDVIRVHH